MHLFAIHYCYEMNAEAVEEHRPPHRAFLRGLLDAGLVAAGAYPEAEEPGALLIVRADSAESVAAMLDDDPFFIHGLIRERTIRLWNPPIGIFT